MGKVTVKYALSQEGQKTNLINGGDGKRYQEIEVKEGSELERVLKLARIDEDGNATLFVEVGPRVRIGDAIPELVNSFNCGVKHKILKTHLDYHYISHPEGMKSEGFDTPQTVGQLLDVAESLVQIKDNHNKKVADLKAQYRKEVDAGWEEVEAAREAQREAERKHEAERRQKQQDKEKAAKKEILDWIEAHGSDRLRMIVAEGYLDASVAVYRDERLAFDRPGWQWDTKWLKGESEFQDVLNPSLEDLQWLRKVREGLRKSDAEASPELSYVNHEDFRGTVIHDWYLGRWAVLLKDQDWSSEGDEE